MGILSHEAKFKQDVKISSDYFKKKKTFLKVVTRGDPYGSLVKQNLNMTQKHEANTAARTQNMVWVD